MPKVLNIFNIFTSFLIFTVIPNIYLYENKMGVGYPQFLGLCFLVLILLFFRAFLKFTEDRQLSFNIGLTRLDLAILVFLVVNLISTIFSKSWYASLFGGMNHSQDGVILLCILIIFYFYFKSESITKTIYLSFWFAILGGITAAVFGLFIHPHTVDYLPFPVRSTSTQESPIFLANYLLFGVGLTFAGLYLKGRIYKTFLGISFVFVFLMFLLTLTRSAWIAGILLFFIFLVYQVFVLKKGLKQLFFNKQAAIIGVSFLSLVIILFPAIKLRVEQTLSDNLAPGTSLGSRLLEYKSTLNIIYDYPILGTGPDTTAYVFPQYKSKDVYKDERESKVITPYIRNYYLQIAHTLGITGLISFLGIISLFIITFLRSNIQSLEGNMRVVLSGLFFAWLGLVIHYLFYTTSITTQILFWGSMGLISGVIDKQKVFAASIPVFKSDSALKYLTFLVFMLLWGLTSVVVINDLISNRIYVKRGQTENLEQRIKLQEHAVSLNPLSVTFNLAVVISNNNKIAHINLEPEGITKEQLEPIFEQNEKSIEIIKKLDPLNPNTAYMFAWYGYEKFRVSKHIKSDRQSEFEKAEKDTKFAISLDPTNPYLWDVLTVVYLEKDGQKLKEAEESARKTIELKANYEFGYHHLVESLKQQGRFDEAIAVCEQNMRVIPQDPFPKREIERIKQLQKALNEKK